MSQIGKEALDWKYGVFRFPFKIRKVIRKWKMGEKIE